MRRLVAIVCVCVIAALACSDSPKWVWPPADFAPIEDGLPFDPNTLIDSTASLTDPYALPQASSVQSFLQQTPYMTSSFLATYASNGVSAADAIVNAAATYQLNPLLFLVRAQMDQALISATSYPSPAARVEFAFGCGCDVTPSPANPAPRCDPSLAGFDKQVDCLARTIRSYLDGVCGPAQATANGWASGVTMETLDGVSVTPANEATAALYQYTPLVMPNVVGGNWFFWNIYQEFANAVFYPGAFGEAWVGDPCCGSSACTFTGGTCVVNYPGGMCSAQCDATTKCPTESSRNSVCVNFVGVGGYCLFDCTSDPCRQGYICQTVSIIGGGSGLACLPPS